MEKIMEDVHYDAWLHWSVTDRCNLNCNYCFYVDSESKRTGEVMKINIPALMDTLNKTNKVFRISFTGGGEPFLIPNLIEACEEISKKHYISFNTNLTSDKIEEFCNRINPSKVLQINASLHIKELEKHNLVNKYISNFLLCKNKGFIINVIEIAHPLLLNEVEKYKKFFQDKEVDIMFNPFLGQYLGKSYPESYTVEEIKAFELNKDMFKIYFPKGNICNAGYNVGIIDEKGDITRCNYIGDKLGNIYEDILFKDIMLSCPTDFCACPLRSFDKCLFEKSLKEKKCLIK